MLTNEKSSSLRGYWKNADLPYGVRGGGGLLGGGRGIGGGCG